MDTKDNYLLQFKVEKKEQYAARMAFFISGFALSTWAPMIPILKEKLNINADVLGVLLLCIGVAAFIFMPIAGILGHRFGCKKIMISASFIMPLTLIVISFLPNIWSCILFLLIFGAAMGVLDVNMNINAVIVEKISDKRMMSGMHAFWSIGCFVSAGLFSILAKIGFNMTVVTMVHCAVVLILLLIFSPYFLAYKGKSSEKAVALPRGIVALFGILICISFLGEGAAMDWSGVFLTEVKSVELSLSAAGYAVYSVAMLIGRLSGDKIVQILGEKKVVTLGFLIASIGFLLIVVVDNLILLPIGFILLGLGASNIVPVLYSLLKYQNDMPINAAVTAITSIGYAGVILGPALLGFIAHNIDITFVFILLSILFFGEIFIAMYVFHRLKK